MIEEMTRALKLADDCKDLDDPDDPYPAQYCGILSRALLAALADNERMRAVVGAAVALRNTWSGPATIRDGISFADEVELSRAFMAAIDAYRTATTPTATGKEGV